MHIFIFCVCVCIYSCFVCVCARTHVPAFSMDTDDSHTNSMTFCVILCNDQDHRSHSRGSPSLPDGVELCPSLPLQKEVSSSPHVCKVTSLRLRYSPLVLERALVGNGSLAQPHTPAQVSKLSVGYVSMLTASHHIFSCSIM